MSKGTLSGNYSHGIALSTSGTGGGSGSYASNPLYVAGTIDGGSGTAVYGSSGQAWTVVNSGTIEAPTGVFGVDLTDGGSVANNGSTASISSADYGIIIKVAVGTVSNSGTIDGAHTGVRLEAGGYLTNAAGAIIEGPSMFGVALDGSPILAVNSGTIEGRQGVYIYSGNLTNNQQGYISASLVGVLSGSVDPVTITNFGTITGSSQYGIMLQLVNGSTVTNEQGGMISGGGEAGVDFARSGSLSNYGMITGTAGAGVRLVQGGIITNGPTGLIQGFTAGIYSEGPATVTNSGTLEASDGSGISLKATGTVIDAGTIIGSGGTAIAFSGNDVLVLERGYALTGGVTAAAGANTLGLGGSVGSALTVSYNGLALHGFRYVQFGTGGNDTLAISNTSGTVPVTISNMTLTSDVIDLTQIGTNGSITGTAGDTLTIAGSLGTVMLQLNATDGPKFTTMSDGNTGTDVAVACFSRGTRVLTPGGEVAVEDLAIGDRVITLSGEARPIKWIGRRSYDGRFVAGNPSVLPICVMAGALADGVPAHDLFVSPEHALYLDDVLVPARLLANGGTIHQVERTARVEYFHIELDAHDIIWAEGAPAETYVDCDNRLMFQNATEFAALYPDDDRPPRRFCATRLDKASAALTGVHAALLQRAGALGHRLDPDPDLHLVVDGRTIWPESIAGDRYRFAIPAGSAAVSLASRSAVPAEIEAGARDNRRLGVPVARLALFDAERSLEARHDDAALSEGFHADEDLQRWTDGLAWLPEAWLRSFPGGAVLEIDLTPTGLCYRVPPPARVAATAA